MAALFMYLSFGTWIASLGISMYATYRLYEYGPYNANLAWGIFRQITDIVTCIALGVALVLMVYTVNRWVENWFFITCIFIFGLFLARIILVFSLLFVARPYIEMQGKKRRHYKEVRGVRVVYPRRNE